MKYLFGIAQYFDGHPLSLVPWRSASLDSSRAVSAIVTLLAALLAAV